MWGWSSKNICHNQNSALQIVSILFCRKSAFIGNDSVNTSLLTCVKILSQWQPYWSVQNNVRLYTFQCRRWKFRVCVRVCLKVCVCVHASWLEVGVLMGVARCKGQLFKSLSLKGVWQWEWPITQTEVFWFWLWKRYITSKWILVSWPNQLSVCGLLLC